MNRSLLLLTSYAQSFGFTKTLHSSYQLFDPITNEIPYLLRQRDSSTEAKSSNIADRFQALTSMSSGYQQRLSPRHHSTRTLTTLMILQNHLARLLPQHKRRQHREPPRIPWERTPIDNSQPLNPPHPKPRIQHRQSIAIRPNRRTTSSMMTPRLGLNILLNTTLWILASQHITRIQLRKRPDRLRHRPIQLPPPLNPLRHRLKILLRALALKEPEMDLRHINR